METTHYTSNKCPLESLTTKLLFLIDSVLIRLLRPLLRNRSHVSHKKGPHPKTRPLQTRPLLNTSRTPLPHSKHIVEQHSHHDIKNDVTEPKTVVPPAGTVLDTQSREELV